MEIVYYNCSVDAIPNPSESNEALILYNYYVDGRCPNIVSFIDAAADKGYVAVLLLGYVDFIDWNTQVSTNTIPAFWVPLVQPVSSRNIFAATAIRSLGRHSAGSWTTARPFGSWRHYGEPVAGTWTLKVTDKGPTISGTLKRWALRLSHSAPLTLTGPVAGASPIQSVAPVKPSAPSAPTAAQTTPVVSSAGTLSCATLLQLSALISIVTIALYL